MPPEDATARLTPREKEVLRAWLDHKSAKEIALDLGITHHAVEKRLKMARTKLGAASSREAARILAHAEEASAGYGQAVTAPPDLPAPPRPGPSRRYRSVLLGGIAMSLALVVVLTLATPPAGQTDIVLNNNLEPIFTQLDANASGYLEGSESPFVELALLDKAFPVEPGADHNGNAILGDGRDPAQVAAFYAAADTDADGRVSFREYYAWSVAQLDQLGVEVTMVVKALPDPQS